MMVRSILTVAAIVSLSAVPAAAAPDGGAGRTLSGQNGWLLTDNANENACFGQARGYWASTLGQGGAEDLGLPEGTSNGDVISERAQNGETHSNDLGFIEDFCLPAVQ